MPRAEGRDHHLIAAQVDDVALAADERAGRWSVGRPVLAADLVEHQLRVIVELDGEPVPTLLAFAKLGTAELVIHPCQTVAARAVHSAADFQTRPPVVIRRLSHSLGPD